MKKLEELYEVTAGCWPWLGYIDSRGYAYITRSAPVQIAHRTVYEDLRGSIPEGMHLDHLCENKWCVNPDHLDVVEPGENSRRATEMTQWRNKIRRFLDTGRWESRSARETREWRGR